MLQANLVATGRVPLFAFLAMMGEHYPTELAAVELTGAEQTAEVAYKDLVADVETTRRAWLAAGVTAGSEVEIDAPNGIAHLVAVLTTWALGCKALILPPPHQEENVIGAPLRTAAAAVNGVPLATERGYAETFPLSLVSSIDSRRAGVHTGGTTGKPRVGSLIREVWVHLGEQLPVHGEIHGMHRFDRQLVSLPLHHGFGFSHGYLFGLSLAHSLVFARLRTHRQFVQQVDNHSVNYATLVPAQMRAINLNGPQSLPSLRTVLHAGSACSYQLKRRWIDALGASRIREAYGSLEAPLTCVITGTEWLERPGTVGRPQFGKISIYLESGQLAANGEVGEVRVQPNASGMRITDSCTDTEHATGDLGFLDAEGYLYLRGRSDLLEDLNGLLINPEEIEEACLSLSGVREARIKVSPGEGERAAYLIAWVNLEDGEEAIPDLARHLRVVLPAELVPKEIWHSATLRRTDTGKRVFESY